MYTCPWRSQGLDKPWTVLRNRDILYFQSVNETLWWFAHGEIIHLFHAARMDLYFYHFSDYPLHVTSTMKIETANSSTCWWLSTTQSTSSPTRKPYTSYIYQPFKTLQCQSQKQVQFQFSWDWLELHFTWHLSRNKIYLIATTPVTFLYSHQEADKWWVYNT